MGSTGTRRVGPWPAALHLDQQSPEVQGLHPGSRGDPYGCLIDKFTRKEASVIWTALNQPLQALKAPKGTHQTNKRWMVAS